MRRMISMRTRTRTRTLSLVTVVALVLTMALGGSSLAAKNPKDVRIACIVKNLVNPFFVSMKQGAEDAAKAYGVNIKVYAPQRPDDVEQQIQIMEDLIQMKVDAMIIVPSDSQGIVPGILRANQAGIPVFVANTRALGGQYMAFAGIDHVLAASTIAKYAAEKVHGKGKVVILEGVPGAQTAIDRKKGFLAVIEKYPGLELLDSQTASYDRVKGMQLMENYLTKYPRIDVVLCANDNMALGAVEAIEAAGRTGEMVVVGIDAIPDALRSIKEGKLTATLNSDPYKQAYIPTEAAIRYILYGEVPKKELSISLEGNVVDATNVDKYLK